MQALTKWNITLNYDLNDVPTDPDQMTLGNKPTSKLRQ